WQQVPSSGSTTRRASASSSPLTAARICSCTTRTSPPTASARCPRAPRCRTRHARARRAPRLSTSSSRD
ncbi:MAG: Cold shock protein of CSP family, partial [uncultured Thermoleophilia bacterium]